MTDQASCVAGESYYLDGDGYLVNPADTTATCYEYSTPGASGGVISTVPCLPQESVETYYLTAGGILQTTTVVPAEFSLDQYGVIVESDTYYRFHYAGTAGQEINPPYPLNQFAFGPCVESQILSGDENLALKDKDDKFFARAGGINGAPYVDIGFQYFYKLQDGYSYDLDNNGVQDRPSGTCLPLLDGLDGTFDGIPVHVTYAVTWPEETPTLHIGETLVEAKTQAGETVGLPEIGSQCVVDVLFDQSVEEGYGESVKLIDPLKEFSADYPLTGADTFDPETGLPAVLKPAIKLGTNRWVFTALPYHLQVRLTYDQVDKQLKLKGVYESGVGEPVLLLNALTARDREVIINGDPDDPGDTVADPVFIAALDNLIAQGATGLAGASPLKFAEMKALTAGDAQGVGYVTLAFNNDPDCPAPTVLSVISVNCPPLYRGEIKVIESPNPFEEKMTLRHNGDFGGESDTKGFQWKYLPADFSGIPEGPDNANENWQDYSFVIPAPGTTPVDQNPDPDITDYVYQGALDVTVQGTGQQLLPDKWFATRYYFDGFGSENICQGWSGWTEPQLYEGWIKRVMKKINLFDQKVKDFHASDVNTLASMISLAGERYEGDIALSDDPEYLQNLGIIEAYETLLERGKALTIGQGTDEQDANKAILFAANRLAGLGMLLGNEAFADAADPTIGFSTEDGQYGTEAPSIFCFQNQVDSLLEEELALLRGRDDEGVRPFYNRLIWNFTLGDGEVAYKENYNITDQNADGEVNEYDAMIQYPQGHGDAWGHYLSAVKYYYDLLMNPDFTWIPQSEAILVAGNAGRGRLPRRALVCRGCCGPGARPGLRSSTSPTGRTMWKTRKASGRGTRTLIPPGPGALTAGPGGPDRERFLTGLSATPSCRRKIQYMKESPRLTAPRLSS